jgi:hypothetical protein
VSRAGREAGGVTLLISHRFSTVRMAGLIVVLDQGRVVEAGDHETLLRSGGAYAHGGAGVLSRIAGIFRGAAASSGAFHGRGDQ